MNFNSIMLFETVLNLYMVLECLVRCSLLKIWDVIFIVSFYKTTTKELKFIALYCQVLLEDIFSKTTKKLTMFHVSLYLTMSSINLLNTL